MQGSFCAFFANHINFLNNNILTPLFLGLSAGWLMPPLCCRMEPGLPGMLKLHPGTWFSGVFMPSLFLKKAWVLNIHHQVHGFGAQEEQHGPFLNISGLAFTGSTLQDRALVTLEGGRDFSWL
jgi:hypothetical protein